MVLGLKLGMFSPLSLASLGFTFWTWMGEFLEQEVPDYVSPISTLISVLVVVHFLVGPRQSVSKAPIYFTFAFFNTVHGLTSLVFFCVTGTSFPTFRIPISSSFNLPIVSTMMFLGTTYHWLRDIPEMVKKAADGENEYKRA